MVSVAIALVTTAMLSLHSRISFHGENHTVGLPFHHEQAMVHAALVQVSVTLGMLTRSRHVDRVNFRHGHDRTFVNDHPVDVLAVRHETFSEVVLSIEPLRIPDLHQADAGQAGYAGLNSRAGLLNINDALKLV